MIPTKFEIARFCNIDLEVKSRRSLTPLVTAWPRAYLPIKEDGRAPHWLLLNAGGMCNTAESTAKGLLGYIERLRGDALRCWKDAHTRVFDVGIQAGGPGRAFEDVTLTPETMRRIAAVGADVKMTVYPAQPACPFYEPYIPPPRRKASKRR